MKNMTSQLHNRIHEWMDSLGFRLNTSQTNRNRNITTRLYFFETFNFLERLDTKNPEKSKFLCFDKYGEKMKVNSLLDLQVAFFDNISQLK